MRGLYILYIFRIFVVAFVFNPTE